MDDDTQLQTLLVIYSCFLVTSQLLDKIDDLQKELFVNSHSVPDIRHDDFSA